MPSLPLDRVLLAVTDADGRFTAVNSVWESLLGWSREELTRRPFLDFVHPEDRDQTEEVMARLKASEYVLTDFVNRYRTTSGGWRWLKWSTWSDGVTWLAFAVDVTEPLERERALRRALDEGRIVPHLQPILDCKSGETVHWEVLARLEPAEGDGPLSAGDFLPVAESTGMVREIDRRMTEFALSLARGETEISVNLSGRSIGHRGFTRDVLELLRRAHPEAVRRLVFEITESAIVLEDENAREFADGVTGLGAKLAIDDFGTGYGSISYLRDLPISYLKIDQALVRNVASNPTDQVLIVSIVAMARALGKQTIAEGIEDEETLKLLRSWGVNRVQGHLLGRPVPPGETSRGGLLAG